MKEESREDKTRIEMCELLRTLSKQLSEVVKTIDDMEQTLYNEEYESTEIERTEQDIWVI